MNYLVNAFQVIKNFNVYKNSESNDSAILLSKLGLVVIK